MPGDDAVELEGEVTGVLPQGRYRVRLANGHQLVARVARRQAEELGYVVCGDRLILSVSPSDFSQGMVRQNLKRNTKHESSRVR